MTKKRPIGATIVGWLLILMFIIGCIMTLGLMIVPLGEYGSYASLYNSFILIVLFNLVLLSLGIGILKLKRLAWVIVLPLSPLLVAILMGIPWVILELLLLAIFRDGQHSAESLGLSPWFFPFWLFTEIYFIHYFTRPRIKEQFK